MKKRSLVLSLLALIFAAGCGENAFKGQEDKNSTEAQQFDISQALDTGDYATVLNDPNANAIDYAAAAMGLAGLDPVKLMDSLTQISQDTAAGTGTQNDLGAVASLAIDPSALQYLQIAETNLITDQQAACFADSTSQECKDLSFQATMTSLTSTITALAQVGQTYVSGFDPTDANGITATEATNFATYITNNIAQFSDPTVKQVDTNGDGTADTSLVDLLAGDVANVVTTLPDADLGAGSDLNTVLNDATNTNTGLNYGCTIDAFGNCLTTDTVTATDISNYLNCVLGSGISGQGGCL